MQKMALLVLLRLGSNSWINYILISCSLDKKARQLSPKLSSQEAWLSKPAQGKSLSSVN